MFILLSENVQYVLKYAFLLSQNTNVLNNMQNKNGIISLHKIQSVKNNLNLHFNNLHLQIMIISVISVHIKGKKKYSI